MQSGLRLLPVHLLLPMLFAGMLLSACDQANPQLMAKKIEQRSELIGGPGGVAKVGDYLIANDRIRATILSADHHAGPSVFGGMLVDADLVRPQAEFRAPGGLDSLAGVFPMANLMVPDPATIGVSIVADGSDGERAVIRVSGKTGLVFEALDMINQGIPLTADQVMNVHSICGLEGVQTDFEFHTDYILEPGKNYIKMVTTIDRAPLRKTEDGTWIEDFDNDGIPDGEDACPIDPIPGTLDLFPPCGSNVPENCLPLEAIVHEPQELEPFNQPVGPIPYMLGELIQLTAEPAETPHKPGIIAGDFVFFGHTNNVYAPGLGFDEATALNRLHEIGYDTFNNPFAFDYLAGVGDRVSYALFTERGKLLIPLFASSATVALAGGIKCLADSSDDATCDAVRYFTMTRYLSVGDGDVSSAVAPALKLQGVPTAHVSGTVVDGGSMEPVSGAQVFLLSIPHSLNEEERSRLESGLLSYDELVGANLEENPAGGPGIISQLVTDVGTRALRDGSFGGNVPAGEFVIVAFKPGRGMSPLHLVNLPAGSRWNHALVLPPAGLVELEVRDGRGERLPVKVTFTSQEVAARPRPELGTSQLSEDIVKVVHLKDGTGMVQLPPGEYKAIASRGFEYEVDSQELTVRYDAATRLTMTIVRSVDVTGWVAADFHQHGINSFDSGVPMPDRVLSNAVEGLGLLTSADHDTITDYRPTIRSMGLDTLIKSLPGVEVSPMETGHIVGFPLRFDMAEYPYYGAPDWTGMSYAQMTQALRDQALFEQDEMVVFVAHPRDGFLGYLDQIGFNPYSTPETKELVPSALANALPIVKDPTCDFDAMELMNAKRFEMIRTPSRGRLREFAYRMECLESLELSTEDLFAMRKALNDIIMRKILTRQPEEQEEWHGTKEDPGNCTLSNFRRRFNQCTPCTLTNVVGEADLCPDDHVPCDAHEGVVEDWFRFLDGATPKGFGEYAPGEMRVPTGLGHSDSHDLTAHEVGYPRNYIRVQDARPAFLDEREAVRSVLNRQVTVSAGPFVELWVNGEEIGSVVSTEDPVSVRVRVQTPSWMQLDRVEVYRSGLLIQVYGPDSISQAGGVRFDQTFEDDPDNRDVWYVAVAAGTGPSVLSRFASTINGVPILKLEMQDVVSQAVNAFPIISTFVPGKPRIPRYFPAYPYAITNPVWVDGDGDGVYTPPRPFTLCPTEGPGGENLLGESNQAIKAQAPPTEQELSAQAFEGIMGLFIHSLRAVAGDH